MVTFKASWLAYATHTETQTHKLHKVKCSILEIKVQNNISDKSENSKLSKHFQ